MSRPMVSVCSHRYINVLDVMALSKIFPTHSYANITFPEPLRKMAVEWLHGLLRSLQKINTELNMVAENPDLMVCTINKHQTQHGPREPGSHGMCDLIATFNCQQWQIWRRSPPPYMAHCCAFFFEKKFEI